MLEEEEKGITNLDKRLTIFYLNSKAGAETTFHIMISG